MSVFGRPNEALEGADTEIQYRFLILNYAFTSQRRQDGEPSPTIRKTMART